MLSNGQKNKIIDLKIQDLLRRIVKNSRGNVFQIQIVPIYMMLIYCSLALIQHLIILTDLIVYNFNELFKRK